MSIILLICAFLAPVRDQEVKSDLTGSIVLSQGVTQPVALRLETLDGVTIDQTFMDPQGNFHFHGLPPGNYLVRVDQMGFYSVREYVRLPILNPVGIRLRPITNQEANTPVDGRFTVDVNELKLPRKVVREYERGVGALKAGDFDDAIEHLRRAVHLAPEYYRAHLALGEAYERKDQITDSESEFRVAASLTRRESEPFERLGAMQLSRHAYQNAAESLSEAARRDPASGKIAFQLGIALFGANRIPDAERALLSAQQLEPHDESVCLLLIRVFLRQKQFTDALTQVNRYIREYPSANKIVEMQELRQRLQRSLP